jgi:hypothetical protein
MCDKCNRAYSGDMNQSIQNTLREGIKNGWTMLGERVYCPGCKPTKNAHSYQQRTECALCKHSSPINTPGGLLVKCSVVNSRVDTRNCPSFERR